MLRRRRTCSGTASSASLITRRLGWIYFTTSLPTTGTQKIQKHQIFPAGSDFLSLPGMFDLRAHKRR